MTSILVVDDDDQLRALLSLVLKRAMYDVYEAQNGNQALQIYSQTPTDLVITDIVMPEKEGIETILEFRRSYPGVRIIAMSGGGRGGAQDYLEVARKLGARHILAKPFLPRELLEAVETVLDSK